MKSLLGFLLRFLSKIIYYSPAWLRNALGDLLGLLWFDVLRIRRSLIDANLQIAFPEMTATERRRVGRASCKNMGRSLMEYFLFPHVSRENLHRYFVFRNYEKYEEQQQENRGVLLLSLHLGSYDFLSVALALRGMDLYLISKEMKLQWLNDFWFTLRKASGLKFISDREAKFDIIRALKNKAAVAFILDQFTGPPIGIRSYFFGRETGTAKGLALFHAWSKAPVLPVYNFRRADGKIEVVFGDPVQCMEHEDREQRLALLTQSYNTLLEDIIRQHPEQWLWVHRRWKTFKY